MSICVVFVCNKKYLQKFDNTYNQLRNNGKYNGDVTLIIGNDLKDSEIKLKEKYNINIKYFPDFKFDETFINIFKNLNRSGIWRNKIMQYHIFYLFDIYFKQWDYILYIDCGVKIFRPIDPIIKMQKSQKVLARNDPWGPFLNKWTLGTQFDTTHSLFENLNKLYNLTDIKQYFQTTIMLYCTNIIDNNLVNKLFNLACKYPISITNDQGIIALYFICIDKKWEEFDIEDNQQYIYDYKPRNNLKPYIMHKWH